MPLTATIATHMPRVVLRAALWGAILSLGAALATGSYAVGYSVGYQEASQWYGGRDVWTGRLSALKGRPTETKPTGEAEGG
jgi:hypothetical protein